MDYLLLIAGFVLLIKGADWLVQGAVQLASRVGISNLIIGLTIVSMGTSAPELIVNILASIDGKPDLATGNVLGSNIANVLLILGAASVVRALPVQRTTVLSEIPFSLAAALLLGFLANTTLLYESGNGDLLLSRGDGVVLLFFFFLFGAYIFFNVREERQAERPTEDAQHHFGPVWRSVLLVVVGIICLFLGGTWVVSGATAIAQRLGMSEAFIGLTVVAVGTSLPELVTSVMAAWRNNADIAVGNVVGSNIFNILWILGISATITPLPFQALSNVDISVVVGSTALILLALIIGRRMVIKRYDGAIFLLCYAAYVWYLVQQG